MTSTVESTEVLVSTISALQTPSQSVQQSYLLNETLREIKEEFDDSGRIAAIIIGVLGGLGIVLSVVSPIILFYGRKIHIILLMVYEDCVLFNILLEVSFVSIL